MDNIKPLIDEVLITEEEKKEVKDNSPESLPLNPTAQGYSGQEVRKKFSKFVTGEKGSVLKLLENKMMKVRENLEVYEEVKRSLPFKHEKITREDFEILVENSLTDPNVEYTVLEENETSYARYIGDIPLSTGGGSGGGGGGGSQIRLTPEPITAPTSFSIPLGEEATFQFNYFHEENAPGNLQVYVNNILVENRTINPGVHTLDFTKLVFNGANNIRIEVKDYLDQMRRLNIVITGLVITVSSTYNETQINTGIVNFSYVVNAPGIDKKIHFQINNNTPYVKTITVPNNIEVFDFPNGVQKVKIYASSVVDGITHTSETKEFIFLVDNGSYIGTMLASKFNVEEIEYGERLNIEYIVYNSENERVNVKGYVNNEKLTDVDVGRNFQIWSVGVLPIGVHDIRLTSGAEELQYMVEVVESSTSISSIDDITLRTFLTAIGKSNADINKERWLNSGANGQTFMFHMNGFNFASNGWINDALVFNGNAMATLEMSPFATEVGNDGRTIEIELETPDVHDGTPLIYSMDDGVGFEIFGHKASIIGSNARIDTHYGEGTKIKISFVISKLYNKVFVFVNGVMSGQSRITSATRFKQNNPSSIKFNETLQGLKVYNFRVYERELNFNEILSNYIFDMPNLTDKFEEFSKTQIYDEQGRVNVDKIKQIIPIMIITMPRDLPSDPNDRPTIPSVSYENLFDEELNFTRQGVSIRTQGTSTLIYPVKNFRIYGGDLNNSPVLLNRGDIPAKVLNIKTDYVDSSVATNSVLAKLFEKMYSEGTRAMVDYPEMGFRTTIFGSPIALFHNRSGELTFEGLCSLNNDKSEPSIYGHGVAPYESSHRFEISYNIGDSAGAFEKPSGITEEEWWAIIKNDFESIYPKEVLTNENYAQLKEFIEFIALNDIDDMDSMELQDYKDEFAQRVNIEYATKYFIVASMFGLLDSFGKNSQLNTWRKEEDSGPFMWYLTFYDLDTAIGLDNEGRILDANGDLIYDYNIELEEGEGFAQANSKFWKVFTTLFVNEIKTEYQHIRVNYFTDETIRKSFFDDHIYLIGRSIYNNSNFLKYIATPGSEEWEYMMNGSRELQIKSWVSNRLKFLDSKYVAGTNKTESMIGFRLQQEVGVPAELLITPYFHQYVTVQFGAAHVLSNIVNERANAFEEVLIVSPHTGAVPFMECRIYGAENIAEIKGFTDMYIDSLQLQYAVNLLKLDLSRENPYSRLETLSLGNNKLLTELNLENLTGLTAPLVIPNLVNLKLLNIAGTNIKEVQLSNGGILEHFVLNDDMTDLTLMNQTYLQQLHFSSLNSLEALRIENTPVDIFDLINHAPNLQYIRLMDYKFMTNKKQVVMDFLSLFYDTGSQQYKFAGLDINGSPTMNPVIYGEIRLQSNESLTSLELELFNDVLPNVSLIQNNLDDYVMVDKGDYFEIEEYLGSDINVQIPMGYSDILDTEDEVVAFEFGTWKYIKGIGNNAFFGNNNIQTVDFGNYIEYIGDNAFENARNLYFTTLPDNIKSIGEAAFRGNEVFDFLFLNYTIESMGFRAFASNTVNPLIIFVGHQSRPSSWDINWARDTYTIEWGRVLRERQFIFQRNNGESHVIYNGYFLNQKPLNPSKQHYNFDDWYVGEQKLVLPLIPDESDGTQVFINANYIPIVYTIEYDNLFDSTNNNNPSTFTVEDLPIVLNETTSVPSQSEIGYEVDYFEGWYNNSNYETEYVSITTGGNKSFFARWYPGLYNVEFNGIDENVSLNNPITFTDLDLPLVLNDPIGVPDGWPSGFGFMGWYSDSGLKDKVTVITTPGTKTLYAKWGVEYVWADPINDFTGTTNDNIRYTGGAYFVIIPEYVQGQAASPFKLTKASTTTGTSGLFYNTSVMGFKILDENENDVSSNLTNAYGMFRGSTAMHIDLSNFDMSNLTVISEMFRDTNYIPSLDFRNNNITALVAYTFGKNSSSNRPKDYEIYLPSTLESIAANTFRYGDNFKIYFDSKPSLVNVSAFGNATNYKAFFKSEDLGFIKEMTNWSSLVANLMGYGYGYELPLILPSQNTTGEMNLTWYSDIAMTNVITNVTDEEAMYYSNSTRANWILTFDERNTSVVITNLTNSDTYSDTSLVPVGSNLKITSATPGSGLTFVGIYLDFEEAFEEDTFIMNKYIEIIAISNSHGYNIDFSTATPSQIQSAIANGYLNDYVVGAEKPITLTNSTKIILRLVDKSGSIIKREDDTFGNLVIEFKQIYQLIGMNATGTNEGGWRDSRMRSTTLPALYDLLPSEWKSIIPNTKIKTMDGGNQDGVSLVETLDKLWLPSEREIFATRSYSHLDEFNALTRFQYYAQNDNNASRIKNNLSGNAGNWWLRSTNSAHAARFVSVSGNDGNVASSNANNDNGVSPCFII